MCTSEEKYSAFFVKILPHKQRMCYPQVVWGKKCNYFFLPTQAKVTAKHIPMLLCVAFLDLVQYDVLFLSVLLSRILPNTGDEIQIDDLQLARLLLYDHTTIINFFYQSLYAAVI